MTKNKPQSQFPGLQRDGKKAGLNMDVSASPIKSSPSESDGHRAETSASRRPKLKSESKQNLRAAVELWDWSISHDYQKFDTLNAVEHHLFDTVEESWIGFEGQRSRMIYEVLDSSLKMKYKEYGYGPFGRGIESGVLKCYHVPDVRLEPLPDWLKFEYVEFADPENPYPIIPDIGYGFKSVYELLGRERASFD